MRRLPPRGRWRRGAASWRRRRHGDAEASVEATAGARGADRMEDRRVLQTRGDFCVAAVLDGHNGDACADHARAGCGGARRRLGGGAGADGGGAARRLPRAAPPSSARPPPTSSIPPSPPSSAACRPRAAAAWRWRTPATATRCSGAATARCRWRSRTPPTTRGGGARRGGGRRIRHGRRQGARRADPGDALPRRPRAAAVRADARARGDRGAAARRRPRARPRDGLWDVLTLERVAHCLHTPPISRPAGQALIADAAEKGTDDNVTVLVVLLRPLEF